MASDGKPVSLKKPKQRPIWWRIHAWIGLKLSLLLTVIFLTGTLAVLANEIDWLVDPALRISPSAPADASWGLLASNVQAAVPNGHIEQIERGAEPWLATVALVHTANGHRQRVLLDPTTGDVKRVAGFASVQRFLRDFHRRLMLPVNIGLLLVASFSLLLMLSLISGLVSYKKFWRGFFKKPRGGGLRKTSGDIHRLAGLWGIWFVALIALTGFWYMIELLGANAPELFPLEPVVENSRAYNLAQPVGKELDRLIAVAHHTYPGLEIRRVLYPFEGVSAIGFQGDADTTLVTEKANAVWVDVATRTPKITFTGHELSIHQRIAEMADPLHFGTWGGLITKLIWFLFGAGLTTLSVTGVIIYSTRLRKGSTSALSIAFQGMKYWLIPIILILLIGLWLTPAVLAG